MAADGQITNQKGDPLDLPTVINSTPGLIHTSQPDGYLDFFNQTRLRFGGKPLELCASPVYRGCLLGPPA
jgi:hypothetical protein